jgi:hypothetical protein
MARLGVLAIAGLLAAGPALVEGREMLGHLTAQDGAAIEARQGSVEIADGSMPYAGGERIVTGASGEAVLTLANGAVAIEAASVAAVTAAKGGYQVVLEAGGVGVTGAAGTGFTILADGLTAELANADGALDVRVAVEAERQIVVANRGAPVRVAHDDRSTHVQAGETWRFERSPQVSASESPRTAWTATLLPPAAAAAGLTGIAVGGRELRLHLDDDDDEEATSPN